MKTGQIKLKASIARASQSFKRSGLKPYQQGQLDGFCGVYGVVNVVHYLCGPLTSDEAVELLMKVMRRMERSRSTLSRVYMGTTKKEAIDSLEHIVVKQYPIRRHKPFYRNKNVSLDCLWHEMRCFLNDHHGIVLICLGGRYDHWTLVRKVTDRSLLLFDSDKLHRLHKRNCTTNDEDKNKAHILYPTHIMYLWSFRRGGHKYV